MIYAIKNHFKKIFSIINILNIFGKIIYIVHHFIQYILTTIDRVHNFFYYF